MILRRDALLCSINDRLGAMLDVQACQFIHRGLSEFARKLDEAGANIPPLDTDFLEEILLANAADHEDLEAMRDQREEERDG